MANAAKNYVFQEDRERRDCDKYTERELRTLFGQSAEEETATTEADDVFILLSAIYAGGGSLVKLKSSKEKYEQEKTFLKEVDQKMQ